MGEETKSEKLFTLPKSIQRSDVKRLARDSEERTMTVIKYMTKQFVDNFSLLRSKEKNGRNTMQQARKRPHDKWYF
jgi:hypothetical protein